MEAKRRPTEIGEEAVRPPYCRRQGLVLTERSWMAWQLEADEEDCSMGLIVEHQGTEHRHCPRDEEKCTGRYTSTRIGGGGGEDSCPGESWSPLRTIGTPAEQAGNHCSLSLAVFTCLLRHESPTRWPCTPKWKWGV